MKNKNIRIVSVSYPQPASLAVQAASIIRTFWYLLLIICHLCQCLYYTLNKPLQETINPAPSCEGAG